MAQNHKMEIQMEIKSSGARLFEIIQNKMYLLPKVCPQIVKDIKLVKGNWESVGSIREWSYIAGDNSETCKDEVEAIDEENKAITFKIYGEAIDKYYKNWKSNVKVTGSLVKWTTDYEKLNDDVPTPTKYKNNMSAVLKSIDDYLSKNA